MVKNVTNIFQIELTRIPHLTPKLLDALVQSSIPVHFGIKRNNYYMMHTSRRVNNFQGTEEVEAFNIMLEQCAVRGFPFLMIKF